MNTTPYFIGIDLSEMIRIISFLLEQPENLNRIAVHMFQTTYDSSDSTIKVIWRDQTPIIFTQIRDKIEKEEYTKHGKHVVLNDVTVIATKVTIIPLVPRPRKSLPMTIMQCPTGVHRTTVDQKAFCSNCIHLLPHMCTEECVDFGCEQVVGVIM